MYLAKKKQCGALLIECPINIEYNKSHDVGLDFTEPTTAKFRSHKFNLLTFSVEELLALREIQLWSPYISNAATEQHNLRVARVFLMSGCQGRPAAQLSGRLPT